MAAPYALSSDLVSAWPAKSLEVAQYIDGQVPLLAMTQNAQTGTTYTFVAADFTKLVTLSNASPVAVTLPLEATVPWPTGTQLRLLNQGAGLVTVAGAVGVTINGTPLTLAQYKAAVITKTGTNIWTFLPFSGGSAPAVISSTTGSPTITTDGTATVYKYTGDGTIVVGTAGVVRVLVVGAGAAGGAADAATGNNFGGGGAGGFATATDFYLPVGTHTITVGAGGAAAAINGAGSSSIAGILTAVGGGTGAYIYSGGGVAQPAGRGGSGGGGYANTGLVNRTGGAGILNQGSAGGVAANAAGAGNGAAGGGGANGVGADGTASVGGAGGVGKESDILVAASNVFYGGGGGGARNSGSPGAGGSGGGGAGGTTNGTNGSVNTGGGGGGAWQNGTPGAGGSGLVVVRVG